MNSNSFEGTYYITTRKGGHQEDGHFRKTEKIHRKRNPLFRRTPRHIKIGVLRNFSFVFHPPFLYTVYIPLIPRTPSFPPLIPLFPYFYSEFIYFYLHLSQTQLLFPKEKSSFYSLYYIFGLFIFIISFLIDEWALVILCSINKINAN